MKLLMLLYNFTLRFQAELELILRHQQRLWQVRVSVLNLSLHKNVFTG